MWCEWNMGEIGELRIWNSSGFFIVGVFIFQNKKEEIWKKKKNEKLKHGVSGIQERCES